MRKMTIRNYVILAVAFAIGLFVALGTGYAMGAEPLMSWTYDAENSTLPAYKTGSWVGTPPPVVRTVVRPRAWYAPRVVVPTVTTRPKIVFESRPAPAYTVVETPKDPVVIRGLFTDRVRVPRGKNLTVVPQE